MIKVQRTFREHGFNDVRRAAAWSTIRWIDGYRDRILLRTPNPVGYGEGIGAW